MQIELSNGQVAEFPDDMPHDQIQRVLQSHFPRESKIPSIDFPRQHEASTFQNLLHGLRQGYPHALKGDINAVSQLFGRQPFEQKELDSRAPLSEKIGRGIGQAGGHLSAILPAAFAGEALIPGIAGASLGAGFAGALTTSGGPKERLTSGLLEAAIPAVLKGSKEAAKIGFSALRRAPTPRKAADIIQKSHEAAYAEATAPLEQAKKLAYERNIGPIRIRSSILSDVPKILGRDEGTMRLLEKSKKGDYESLDKLQSDVKTESRKLLQADTHADRLLGKDAHSLAEKIIGGMKVHAQYKGHGDIADLLTEGKSKYAEFAKMYLDNPTISKLVGKDRVVPKNLLSKLESDTAFFNKLKSEIPDIGKMLELQKSQKRLKKYAKTAASLGHAGALSKYLLGNGAHNPRND